MEYAILRKILNKAPRNQRAHILDSTGRTFCQTENVHRKKPIDLVLFAKPPKGVAVCKVCQEVKNELELDIYREPSLKALMGERMV